MKRYTHLSACLLFACARPGASHSTNIFGTDDRVVTPNEAPYTAVGRLDVGCTGTLIGQRLALTAAHCVIEAATGNVRSGLDYFRPNLRGGASTEALWIDHAWLGTAKPEDDRLNDWAIVRVEKPAGAYARLTPLDLPVASQLPFTTTLVGYSTDLNGGANPTMHRGCNIVQVVEGKYFHACDAASGVSGGPMINRVNGNDYVIGIMVSEYRNGATDTVHRDTFSADYANVAVPASRFAATALTLAQTVDAGLPAPALDGVLERSNPNQRPVPGPSPGPSPAPAPSPSGPAPQPPAPHSPPLAPLSVLSQRGGFLHSTVNVIEAQTPLLDRFAYTYHLGDLAQLSSALQSSISGLDTALAGMQSTDLICSRYDALAEAVTHLNQYHPLPSPGLSAELGLYLARVTRAMEDLDSALFH